ncbi:MAG: amidohydrolase family protein, partial [Candidatus Bipolaricaulota bacterium]
LMRESGGKLIAFADCAFGGIYEDSTQVVAEIERAVGELGLRGVKVHPSNLKVAPDDARMGPVVRAATRLGIPVVFHSNPSAFDVPFDLSSPARVYQLLVACDLAEKVPIVLAHMGGVRFLDLVAGYGYVDFSGTLLWLCELYGTEFAERLLRQIGLDRVLFGTDYPIHAYERYYAVLDEMQFTDAEIEKIAYGNAAKLLTLG